MFRILLFSLAVLAALALVYFFVLGYVSKSGQPVGLVGGTLSPCPDKPNCVSSENPEDTPHYVKPLHYSAASAEAAWTDLRDTIEKTGGRITLVKKAYLSATYSVSLFGFIDDVECRLDTSEQTIHIRSASRVGHNDLGVNQKRVAEIARTFYQKTKKKKNDGPLINAAE